MLDEVTLRRNVHSPCAQRLNHSKAFRPKLVQLSPLIFFALTSQSAKLTVQDPLGRVEPATAHLVAIASTATATRIVPSCWCFHCSLSNVRTIAEQPREQMIRVCADPSVTTFEKPAQLVQYDTNILKHLVAQRECTRRFDFEIAPALEISAHVSHLKCLTPCVISGLTRNQEDRKTRRPRTPWRPPKLLRLLGTVFLLPVCESTGLVETISSLAADRSTPLLNLTS